MLYQPTRPDRYLWDTWLLPHEGRYHLFHMQKVAGEIDSVEIGHAVSEDLVRWTMLEPALRLAPPGAWDSVRFRTGAALHHDGRFYLFYGAAPDHVDRVGLATSADLSAWERHPGNPIAVPDPRWYEHDHTTCAIENVAWRDPCILRQGGGWLMLLSARLKEGPVGGRGAIATLRSSDLVRWEVGRPLDVPLGFNVPEVPDLFELDGKWFLLHSTGHGMGTRFPTCDPGLTAGTFVLWADRPEGPYRRPPRDVLIGSPADRMSAYVARTAETPHGRIAYFHNVYPRQPGRGPRGSFGLPKALATDAAGVKAVYLPLLAPYRGEPLAQPLAAAPHWSDKEQPGRWTLGTTSAQGQAAFGTAAQPLAGEALDLELTTTATVREGRGAGLGLRVDPNGRGLAVVCDARLGTVGVAEMRRASSGVAWRVLAERRAAVAVGVPLALRVVVLNDVVEVFLDDELMLSVVAEGYGAGRLALLVDDARVTFDDLKAWRLTVR